MTTRLTSYHNGKIDLAFPVQGSRVAIGREADNEIQLPHEKVSKHHAVLMPIPGGWSIQDLRSTNGVFVNGKPVQHAELKHGDRLEIGPYELHFETKALSDEWVPSYVMDLSSKAHEHTMLQPKPPQKG